MTEQEKPEAILQAALELIAERSFHDTGVSLIAKHHRAGLPALDDHALEAIADACYQAVML